MKNKNLLVLVGLSIIAKPVIAFVTTGVFHSFVDMFDLNFYYTYAVMFAHGATPYITFPFEYPVLAWVPIGIAFVVSGVFPALGFPLIFQLLMIVCDAITTVCIYLIGRKLFTDEKVAIIASVLYITSFSAGYFVITKYDAFPTCLMMVGLVLTVYGKELYETISGYWMLTFGFFAKVFPILVVPFAVLYNAKETSLKQEIWAAAKSLLLLAVVFVLPLGILSIDTIRMYIPVRTDIYGVYANTLTFTIYTWLHDIGGLGITVNIVSTILYSAAVGIIALCLYIAYREPGKNIRLFLKLVLATILLVVLSTSVRSPQYIVWFTPLLCLLAAGDLKKMVLVYAVQVTAFVEFPLTFGTFYTATAYTISRATIGGQAALVMFTIEYVVLIVCGWVLINPRELISHGRVGTILV